MSINHERCHGGHVFGVQMRDIIRGGESEILERFISYLTRGKMQIDRFMQRQQPWDTTSFPAVGQNVIPVLELQAHD
jgi:hypothetical protein